MRLILAGIAILGFMAAAVTPSAAQSGSPPVDYGIIWPGLMTIGVLLPVVADAGPIAGFAEAAVGTGLLYGSVVHLNPDLLFLGAGGIAGGSALLLLRDKPKATQLGAHFAAWSLAAVVTTSHRWNNGYQRVRPVFGPGKVGFRIDLGRR